MILSIVLGAMSISIPLFVIAWFLKRIVEILEKNEKDETKLLKEWPKPSYDSKWFDKNLSRPRYPESENKKLEASKVDVPPQSPQKDTKDTRDTSNLLPFKPKSGFRG